MKKLLLLLSFLNFANVQAQDSVVNYSTKIVNKKQIGHSDGYDSKGFLGTNIFSANIEITAKEKTVLIPTLYTIDDRKNESIHIESEKAKVSENELLQLGISKKDIIEKMSPKYKNFTWN